MNSFIIPSGAFLPIVCSYARHVIASPAAICFTIIAIALLAYSTWKLIKKKTIAGYFLSAVTFIMSLFVFLFGVFLPIYLQQSMGRSLGGLFKSDCYDGWDHPQYYNYGDSAHLYWTLGLTALCLGLYLAVRALKKSCK